MGDWRALSQQLAGIDDSLRLTWPELSSLVGGLPPSAAKHRTWWTGDRPHVRVWREAGFRVAELVMGSTVTFVRTESELTVEAGPPTADHNAHSSGSGSVSSASADMSDLLLVTCVKSKLQRPAAAKDLYTSALFVRQRQYAEALGWPWFILSAEHGLVAPDEWLAPYERYLPDTSATYRVAWGSWVAERLEMLAGPLTGKTIEIHASAPYIDAVARQLGGKGARVIAPLEGLMLGQRLSWYDQQGNPSRDPASDDRPGPVSSDTASAFVKILIDEPGAITPAEFLALPRTELKTPGLYSWWVDETGASDLSDGLGITVAQGLIYAGLAGATKWPSGRPSTNTLWLRIADMHLGGNHEFSTFRLTLGSILAAAGQRDCIDEVALTAWMKAHLLVRVAAVEDADTLGRLEAEVLKALDPPLNLQGMTATPARSRLKELRRIYRHQDGRS